MLKKSVTYPIQFVLVIVVSFQCVTHRFSFFLIRQEKGAVPFFRQCNFPCWSLRHLSVILNAISYYLYISINLGMSHIHRNRTLIPQALGTELDFSDKLSTFVAMLFFFDF